MLYPVAMLRAGHAGAVQLAAITAQFVAIPVKLAAVLAQFTAILHDFAVQRLHSLVAGTSVG
jgi:hypothetical protein